MVSLCGLEGLGFRVVSTLISEYIDDRPLLSFNMSFHFSHASEMQLHAMRYTVRLSFIKGNVQC